MPRKTPAEKLRTKINRLLMDGDIYTESNNSIMAYGRLLFTHSDQSIDYSTIRFFPSRKEEFVTTALEASFILSDETLNLLSSNISKPPRGIIVYRQHKLDS